MKLFRKCLLVVIVIILLFGLYDSFFNGLLSKDGYQSVTEQLNDVKEPKKP